MIFRVAALWLGLLLLLLFSGCARDLPSVADTHPFTCAGPFAEKTLTALQLTLVLKEHASWLDGNERLRSSTGRANLCKADLRHVDLSKATLEEANLDGANLFKANLTTARLKGASLNYAHLQGATLVDAVLVGASLVAANLDDSDLLNADFLGANLTEASLARARLERTRLEYSSLVKATFVDVDPLHASFIGADVYAAVFDVQPGKLPNIETFALADRLFGIKALQYPLFLSQLREEFKKKGYKWPERQLTFAIKQAERQGRWRQAFTTEQLPLLERVLAASEAAFMYTLFEIPSAYGMRPGRALVGLVLLIPGFAMCYWVALQTPDGSDGGIWMVWSPDRIRKEDESTTLLTVVDWPDGPGPRRTLSRWGALGFAVYFSILSAFHIGWRELNVGSWITRLQPREYGLRASKWVRTVSGIQALVSVYLIALWVLTYFGSPFDW